MGGPIEIYTDGGCHGNPGPGGWAFLLNCDEEYIERKGNQRETTNNRMELTAVISALEYVSSEELLKGRPIILHTDSQYVKNGINSWIHTWVKNGWKTSAGKPVKNREYWIRLKAVNDLLKVSWKWVKGHAGNEENERCDALVQEAIGEIEKM